MAARGVLKLSLQGKAGQRGQAGLGAPGSHGICAGASPPLKDRPGLLGMLPAARAIVGAGEEVPSLLAHLLHQPPQALLAICMAATAPCSSISGEGRKQRLTSSPQAQSNNNASRYIMQLCYSSRAER